MFRYDSSVADDTPRWVVPLRRKLKAAVKARKLTQQQLADAAGVSQSAVSQFFKGTTNEPGGNLLVEGCRLLQISIDELVQLKHESSPVSAEARIEEHRAVLAQLVAALVDVIARADARDETSEPRAQSTDRDKSD